MDIVRVKRLEDGKAVGKSFRCYKSEQFDEKSGELLNVIYYELSPTGIIDNIVIENVTEHYDRIPIPLVKCETICREVKYKFVDFTCEIDEDGNPIPKEAKYIYPILSFRKGYVRKSSACPKEEASTEKGKLKAQLKALNKLKKTPEQVLEAKALKLKIKNIGVKLPKDQRVKSHNTINVKGRGKDKRNRVIVNIPTTYIHGKK